MKLSLLVVALEAVAVAQALPAPGGKGGGSLLDKISDLFSSRPAARTCPKTPSKLDQAGAGFQRFAWVGAGLARSSAPHYVCRDGDQLLTPASLTFLRQQRITHVISLNEQARSPAIAGALRGHGIDYTPLPVRDFGAPTRRDLEAAYDAFSAHRGGRTLVWCGYGDGRTGTLITALQIFMANEQPKPKRISHRDYKKNRVETQGQCRVLDALQADLRG
ncbi:hypothetical protein CDD83_9289 [Cordyceps sp. RAO-2017]|nr:hypothetical protein CDD83_9289 [Cordyceps sp. RAO-2017]